ncbi:Large cysteine-rich periplasmic protein OmcB [Maioricimonas rarisocia]|uniref:Large cysteine-rich periplasmic protein OmcB n=1 Tax=Maioricimonas rarisocia TaxID=2528026 RepID=A0A517ZCM1_9PLAN|nr:DUF11 domain-containing protein [Maioricimonas rarisocia]QDU40201.1 Large cysteine-rich periplasmic protein OmcB [Maioricimonas rarisocia]
MRRIVWMLAIGGLLGVPMNPGFAQTGASATGDKSPATTPKRYVRYYSAGGAAAANTPTTAPRAKNYAELFDTPAATAEEVIQAEYEAGLEAKASYTIQPVRATDDSARPFPAAGPAATAEPAPQGHRLTEPISIEPSVDEAAPAPRGNVTVAPRATAATEPVAAPVAVAEAGSLPPNVTVEWVRTGTMNVGQECTCDLIVENTGGSAATQVDVEAHFPATVRLLSAEPHPDVARGHLGWSFDSLAAGAKRVIHIRMKPLQAGDVATEAHVRFTSARQTTFSVAEPKLAVKLDGPEQVQVGEPASYMVSISNPGTGIASNVQLEAAIPEGLEHSRGERLLMDVGSLNPGETRQVRLALVAVTGGPQAIQVQARAESGLVQNASGEVTVIAPSLAVKLDGPGLRYLGRQATYTLHVHNDGAAGTDNVRLMHRVPDGFEFVSADRGARFDETTGLVNWFLGRLEPGQSLEAHVTLVAKKAGSHQHLTRATSENGATSDARITTNVEGTSSLVMEIADLDDPVETGSETAYEIRVKNEGSAAASNVGVACELADGMKFLKASVPVEHLEQEGVIIFQPVGKVAPGETVTYRVHVRGEKSGNMRFRCRLSSESIAEPLTLDELTKFYGE